MIKRLWAVGFMALCLGLAWYQPASAHVLIRDSSGSIGAVLHVVPDDDPIAGQPSDLYFDIQTSAISKDSAGLTITNLATDKTDTVPVEVAGSGVGAQYTFASQGTYRLSLTIESDKTYQFSYAQRVSRGVTGSALDKPTYPLAQAGLVFGGIGLLMIGIVRVNRRKDIRRQSTF